MKRIWIILWLFLAAAGNTAFAERIIYVDADATGANNGSSWANAYKYLQDALADANSSPKPVEVRVAQGIYRPNEDPLDTDGTGYRDRREDTFQLINNMTIKGGYAGAGYPDPNARNLELYETILSGDLNGDDEDTLDPCDLLNHPTRDENSYHVVTAHVCDETAVLDGFTITGGNANVFSYYRDMGGGVSCGSPTLRNCTLIHNSAYDGGGMVNWGQSVLINCTFAENWAGYDAGGMYNSGAPILTNCTFSGNSARYCGGGMKSFDPRGRATLINCIFEDNSAAYGGGIYGDYGATFRITNCILRRNSADNEGGGMCNWGWSFAELINCTLSGNCASQSGGGISNNRSELIMSNCSIMENLAGNEGGGIYHFTRHEWESGPTIKNCTFAGNSAEKGTTLYCTRRYLSEPVSIQFANCILWNGGIEIWNNDGSTITITYTDAQGGQSAIYDPCGTVIWGAGNIDVDPCFAQPGYWDPNGTPADTNDDFWVDGDYHLKSQAGRWEPAKQAWITDDVTSLCIDAGDPGSPIGLEPFPNGGIINIGAYGGTEEASKSYFGEPVCETIVAGDINGDCKVDFWDLALMTSHWLE
jgi:hypothetical protein